MAWTDVSTGDKVEAAHINDIHQALNGTVGKAQPMAFTEVDESATYALDVRNKDATNSLIARFRNAANEVVLSVVKEAVNTAKQIVSTVATGTAPFVVNSTTKVDNLNVDQVDGKDSTDFVLCDGTQPLTADWDAGGYEIRAQTFESDVATGTAPLTVASTTVVTNLNADQVDGKHAGTSAGNVLVLDSSGYVPLANLSAIAAGNIANRTRSFLVTPNVEADTINGTSCPDNVSTSLYGAFRVPADFASSMTIKAVLVNNTGSGNIYHSSDAEWGAVGEVANSGSASFAAAAEAMSGYKVVYELASFDCPGIAVNDNVGLRYIRRGANMYDTLGNWVSFMGWLVSYTADS